MTHHAGRAPTSLSFSARSLRLTAIALIGIGTAVSTSPMSGRVSARTRDLSSAELLLEAEARPVSLAAADFDADGVPDLLAGYATGEGGKLVLHRGNVDALYPHTPEARARKLAGQFTAAPFLPGTRTFAVPAAPDFLERVGIEHLGRAGRAAVPLAQQMDSVHQSSPQKEKPHPGAIARASPGPAGNRATPPRKRPSVRAGEAVTSLRARAPSGPPPPAARPRGRTNPIGSAGCHEGKAFDYCTKWMRSP